MMETRIHSAAAETSTLLDENQLALTAAVNPEDAIADEKVDFAATLQDLIASRGFSEPQAQTNSSLSFSMNSSGDDPNPRIAMLATSIPSSTRITDKTWGAAISSDTIRN